MKKKLTLLIALSITLIIAIIGIFMAPIATTNADIQEASTAVVEEEINPPFNETQIRRIEMLVYKTRPVIDTTIISQEIVEQAMEKVAEQITAPAVVEQYPEARKIWDIMKSWGWSDETCAGIIGNMMAEIGGKTLNLSDWASNGGCGYGLIQWTGSRRTTIKNKYGAQPTIEQQLEFMKDELYGTNGITQQVSQEVLDIILNTNGQRTPEEIAYTFACRFERCAERYRAMRRDLARDAYNYFVNK